MLIESKNVVQKTNEEFIEHTKMIIQAAVKIFFTKHLHNLRIFRRFEKYFVESCKN